MKAASLKLNSIPLFLQRYISCINDPVSFPHLPVMKDEVVQLLDPKPNQVVLDMTFGGGGHTRALLDKTPDLTCYCLDRDPSSLIYAEQTRRLFNKSSKSLVSLVGKFSDLPKLCREHGLQPKSVDMIIIDLGVSSQQLDTVERGFSYQSNGLLDMRMDPSDSKGITAGDVVNSLDAAELAQVFKLYGEERYARRIANAIVDYRHTMGPLRSTKQLADITSTVVPSASRFSDKSRQLMRSRTHPAARVFQALRIFVNDELNELCYGLGVAELLLRSGGRLVVISFHSLEDRLVKWTFTRELDGSVGLATALANLTSVGAGGLEKRRTLLQQLSVMDPAATVPASHRWSTVGGPLMPSEDEVITNPRSRSAKLRFGEKI